ncbi:endolytic transglycosylase MltG [bacterium]|nr:endolytic transglycosylase MltG [bacterium]
MPKKQTHISIKTKLTLATLIIMAIVVSSIVYLLSSIPLHVTKEITLQDKSISGTVETLSQADAIDHPFAFYVLISIYHGISGRNLYEGELVVEPMISHARLMKLLFTGQSGVTINVVIPEGSDLRRIASILKKRLDIDSSQFMKNSLDDSVCKALGVRQTSMEGYYMPDTYNMYKKQLPSEIIKKLTVIHQMFWNKRCASLLKQSPYTKHEILTLASIIEAETSVASERARISGVYHNRLKRGIKLEADPTVQYAIGKRKRLYYSDLRIDSPYNTYKYSGLPPGPINCPGRESILAALQPEYHDYVFFVAKGDGSGEHVFSSNGRDHEKAVNAYRKKRDM